MDKVVDRTDVVACNLRGEAFMGRCCRSFCILKIIYWQNFVVFLTKGNFWTGKFLMGKF